MAESGLDPRMGSRATVQGCTDCGFGPIGEAANAPPWRAALASVLSAKPQTRRPWRAALASVLSAKRFPARPAGAFLQFPGFPYNAPPLAGKRTRDGREPLLIRANGWVAQLVEHAIENRSVGSSILPPATIFPERAGVRLSLEA